MERKETRRKAKKRLKLVDVREIVPQARKVSKECIRIDHTVSSSEFNSKSVRPCCQSNCTLKFIQSW